MNIQTFLYDLENKDLSFTASKWLIEKFPFVFNDDSEGYLQWKEQLSKKIGVDSRAISFIGSACVGFSLNPHKNFKAFDSKSDFDIALISHHYFDLAWHELRCLGTKILGLSTRELNCVNDHRKNYIYWGTIATDKILPIFSFGKDWVIALAEMAQLYPAEGREINVRIYNDFESLRSYHIHNLKYLRSKIL